MKKRVEDLALFGGPPLFSSVQAFGQLDLPTRIPFLGMPVKFLPAGA